MDLPEEKLTYMFSTFQNYAENKESDTWKQVNTLQEKLEISKSNSFEICKNIKRFYGREQFNITNQYVTLQGKHIDFCEQIETLEAKLESLKLISTTDIEKITIQYKNYNKVQEEMGKDKIKQIQMQIDQGILEHEKRVQQLCNELDLAEATTALQQDEVETELCKELVDINVKIRQMQKINADLHTEIDNIKNRQQKVSKENRNSNIMCIAEEEYNKNVQVDQRSYNRTPQNNFKETLLSFSDPLESNYTRTNRKKSYPVNYMQNIPNKDLNMPKNVDKIRVLQARSNDIISKYQPLTVSTIGEKINYSQTNKNVVFDKLSNDKQNNFPNKCKKNIEQNSGDFIPKKNAPKKRKLFDPENLEYLNNLRIGSDVED